MIEYFKNLLLVITICSFVIENLPWISLLLGFSYIFFSLISSTNNGRLYIDDFHRSISISWFMLFAYLTILTVLIPYYRTDLPIIRWRWFRAILFFVLIYKDTKGRTHLQKNILYFYAISAITCCILMSMGIGISIDAEQYEMGVVRLTFLGTNSNKMAMFYTYAVAILLLYIEEGWFWNISKKYRCIFSGIFLIILCRGIALTGSRGAFIVVIAMFGYYVLFYQKNGGFAKKILLTCLTAFFVYYLIDVMNSVDVFSRRVEMTTEGQHGERDILVNAALKVFSEYPMGVGLNSVYDYMSLYMGKSKTPHNLFAYMLAGGGIFGFILFLSIILRTAKIIYIKTKEYRLLMPILLLIIALLDFNKNGGSLEFSINYCMLSLALSMSNNNEL